MLQSSRMHDFASNSPQDGDEGRDLIDLGWLLAAARRQAWLIALGAVAGIALGLVYILNAVPLYTASVDILIDKGRSQFIDQYESSGASGAIQDKSEILSSGRTDQVRAAGPCRRREAQADRGRRVHGGHAEPGKLRAGRGRRGNRLVALAARRRTSEASDEGTYDVVGEAADTLRGGVDVDRTGRTYVLSVSYTAKSAELASRIAQGYGEAYLDDQLQSKYEATRRASAWLQDRISELKQQSYEADLQVQKFRSENNLIAAGGQLVSEQQLSEVNTQLVSAQAATAEAKARLDQIDSLINSGRTDAVVNQSLQSATINSLRERYLDASRLKTEIEAKLGPTHVQVIRLTEQMAELERLIFEELRRIAKSYKSDYLVALSRQQSLQDSMSKIVGVNASANTTQVKLRELERQSATFKLLYDTFLQRYQETVQQQSFPISNARIITPAKPPDRASYPRTSKTLALFLVLGTMASTGLAAFLEYRDRFFRTGDQVRSEAKVEFLGFLPFIEPGKSKPDTLSGRSPATGSGVTVRSPLMCGRTRFRRSPRRCAT